jgi:hypothetical protein
MILRLWDATGLCAGVRDRIPMDVLLMSEDITGDTLL